MIQTCCPISRCLARRTRGPRCAVSHTRSHSQARALTASHYHRAPLSRSRAFPRGIVPDLGVHDHEFTASHARLIPYISYLRLSKSTIPSFYLPHDGLDSRLPLSSHITHIIGGFLLAFSASVLGGYPVVEVDLLQCMYIGLMTFRELHCTNVDENSIRRVGRTVFETLAKSAHVKISILSIVLAAWQPLLELTGAQYSISDI